MANEDLGQPGGTETSSAPASPVTSEPSSTPSVAAAPPATPTGFTYKEDRTDWIPRHRFNEVSQQAQRARDLESQIAERDRKIQALAGVSPSDSNSQQAEAVKEAFFNLPGMGAFRKLANMTDAQIDALLQVPDQIGRTNDAELRQWKQHGNKQVQYIGEKVSEALGLDAPDAEQLDDLRNLFSKWVKTRATAEMQATGESATVLRYEEGDQKLLDEFVSQHTKRWVEPARRTAAASNFNRMRPIPSSVGRTQVTSVARPAAFKSLDERIEYAANLAKERGVQFGR
jgi:hypothetical protein